MNKAELIENVKKMLFGSQAEIKMAETRLEDGTLIYTDSDEFEVGSEVYTLDEEGNKVPVFDAEHKLEDGTIVATVGGKITEIKPVENLEEKKDEEMVEEKKEEMADYPNGEKKDEKMVEEEDLLAKIVLLEERIKALESSKGEMEKDLEEKETKLSKVQEATVYLAEEFSKTPAGEKVEVSKSGFIDNFKKIGNREAKLKELMTIINKKDN
jgi:coenzyme F420-reducing hydrogenase delta subunit